MADSTGGALGRYAAKLTVAIDGPGSPSAESCQVGSCLAGQHGVVSVEHDCRSGQLNVHYDMRKNTARLLRAILRDRIAACAPPIQLSEAHCQDADLPELTVAHETKGRVRLRIDHPATHLSA